MIFTLNPKKEDIENLINSFEIPTFLQSENWAKFQEALGRKSIKIGIYKNDKLILGGFGFSYKITFFKYLYFPRGPLIKKEYQEDKNLWDFLLSKLKTTFKKDFFLIRLEPYQRTEPCFFKNFNLSYRKYIQYPETLLLNLNFSLEELLKEMHYKTRYNIKLSYKKEVKTKIFDYFDEKVFESFYKILEKTSKEKRFRIYPKGYYEKMLKTLMPLGNIKLFVIFLNDKIIGANIVYFFKNIAVYLHGAIDKKYSNLMGAYQLQWEAIKYAKNLGLRWYDFGGVMINKRYNPNWAGFSNFKIKFTSEKTRKILEWPGVFELPLNHFKYKIFKSLRKIRNKI